MASGRMRQTYSGDLPHHIIDGLRRLPFGQIVILVQLEPTVPRLLTFCDMSGANDRIALLPSMKVDEYTAHSLTTGPGCAEIYVAGAGER